MNTALINQALQDRILFQLLYIRYCPADVVAGRIPEFSGYLSALLDLGLISAHQSEILFGLAISAFIEPSMRRVSSSEVVKPQAQVQANEKPESVPAPTSSAGLHLLGVLGKDRSGQACSISIRALRPMPPFIGAKGQRSLAGNSSFQVLHAHAKLPASSLLVLHTEHRQACAVCTDI